MKTDPLIEILKAEFERKKNRNKSYSLRSYSRDLGLDPSNLSKIMNYRKKVGPVLRLKVGQKLGFENNEIESWLTSPSRSNTKDGDYNNHRLDIFKVISDWQHYALLEYFKLQNKSSKPSEIATYLSLKLSIVKESLHRLITVGLLKKTENGYLATDDFSSSILSVTTSTAHREQQRQILEGAISALKTVPVEFRSQSSMTLAIDSEKLQEAKDLIKTFRREMGRLLSTSNRLDHVYQLSISLYPVTKLNIKKES